MQRDLGVLLLLCGLASPLAHWLITTSQCWRVNTVVRSLVYAPERLEAAEPVNIPIRGGISFPKVLVDGLRVEVLRDRSHALSIAWLDSEHSPVTPWDVAFQYVISSGLALMSILGYGLLKFGGGVSTLGKACLGLSVLSGLGVLLWPYIR